ncbi:MAG: ankyrin repeat domain-containing protein, partial [Synergistaceae bacterium]|nr:ankyrin repeat domain-containing protein [Synergistaceae bacterium]
IKMIEKGADLNIKDKHRVTPVMGAARCSKGIALKMLLDRGVDINCRDTLGGYMAIHEAVEQDCTENVKLLVKAGADVNAFDSGGSSPLALALDEKNFAMAKLLLDAGAKLAGVAESLLTDEIREYIPDRKRLEAAAPNVRQV